jgi:hypothetical protein
MDRDTEVVAHASPPLRPTITSEEDANQTINAGMADVEVGTTTPRRGRLVVQKNRPGDCSFRVGFNILRIH